MGWGDLHILVDSLPVFILFYCFVEEKIFARGKNPSELLIVPSDKTSKVSSLWHNLGYTLISNFELVYDNNLKCISHRISN